MLEEKSLVKWFSDNISLIQSQHIYIHSGFKPIIVSVRSNSLKVIALGPHTKEKLFCWVWVLLHFVVCTVYVLFFVMSFFVSVFFFVSPSPTDIQQHIPVRLAAVFKSLASLHEVKRVKHCTSFQTLPGFLFCHGPFFFYQSLSSKALQFRILVRYEKSQGSHYSEMMCWKCEFAASFWLSWSSSGCTALLCFTECFFLSASHDETWSNKKKTSIQCLRDAERQKVNQHVMYGL